MRLYHESFCYIHLLLSQIVFEKKQHNFSKSLQLHIFVLKEQSTCTLNSHKLWSKNIYDHELMLSVVLIDIHKLSQSIF